MHDTQRSPLAEQDHDAHVVTHNEHHAEEQAAIDRIRIFSSRLHGLIMKLPGFAGFELNANGVRIFLDETHGCVETAEKLAEYAYRDASAHLHAVSRIPVGPDGTMPGKKMERRL